MVVSEETKRWARRQRIHQLLLFTETGAGSCPMACTYCFLAKSGENKKMARSTLHRAIDFLREIACVRRKVCTFSGQSR